MLPYMTRQHLETVLSSLERYSADKDSVHLAPVANVIMQELHLAPQDPILRQICSHPYTITQFGEALVRSTHLPFDDPDEPLSKRIRDQLWKDRSDSQYVTIRRFLPSGGYYYGYDYFTPEAAYAILNAAPILVTISAEPWHKEMMFETELGLLTRLEVKVIATLFFSSYSWHGPFFYFIFGPDPIEVPASVALDEGSSLSPAALPRLSFVLEVFDRFRLVEARSAVPQLPTQGPFEFRQQALDPSRSSGFYQAFDLQDNLALRTAFLLIKAASLWSHGGHIYGEDAAANLFFALEGCLHLIHRRFNSSANFQFAPVVQHIETVFPSKPGYPAMLEDAHEKRVQIVHPEPRIDIGWLPNLYADDFYENFGMANDLFYYAITGDTLPDEDT